MSRYENISLEIDTMKELIIQINKRFDQMYKKIDILDRKVDKLDNSVSEIKDIVTEINKKLDSRKGK